jgi:hypothetical protein
LTAVIKFIEENKESDISTSILGRSVHIYKTWGVLGLYIYNKENTDYHSFTKGALENAKNKLLAFCNKNNIDVECEAIEENTINEVVKEQSPQETDKYNKLRELKLLLDDGVITQDEFDKKLI